MGSSAGGGYSTVEDMLKFNKSLYNYELLNKKLTRLLLSDQVEIPDRKFTFGFESIYENNHRIISKRRFSPWR